MRIYLVGFMGSGKSTLGRAVADHLEVTFVDTDEIIEETEQEAIASIFMDKGEYYFRELETRALSMTLQFPKALISTGGGLPCFHQHMDRMKVEGITIYLEWSWNQLRQNLEQEDQANRPLLAGDRSELYWEKIKALFDLRRPFYEQAAMTIEMSGNVDADEGRLLQACNYIWK